ncbi:hypothetical protein [Paenibacillus sp. J22TS3]|uniref:hypothetical protein n=1 Tax=Paenibacillus sp. J22TS3 TaxID=2807192 RepID=UPI001B27BE57|nr:hypothetical protein [Paenibacillus sp. J22TS3]GIP23800.1 hypothetical protein J22TS3_40750 [Paenibacillus sp. J22TS3]
MLSTQQRLSLLEERLTSDHHRDLYLQTKHLMDSLDAYEEKHRRIVNIQAIEGGIKPQHEVEQVFYSTIRDFREQLLRTLEKTAEDLEHKYDKSYHKHYQDGVD